MTYAGFITNIYIFLPCNLPSVSPIGCSQPEASGVRNLWGSVPRDMEQSKGRERKGLKNWHNLLGQVPTGIVFRQGLLFQPESL